MTLTQWELLSSEYRHDLLKNGYLLRVNSFIAWLNSNDAKNDISDKFLNTYFLNWEKLYQEGNQIILTYKNEMKPSRILLGKNKITFNIDWLKFLVDETWVSNNNVNHWIESVTNLLEKSNSQYNSLKNITNNYDIINLRNPSTIDTFTQYYNTCCDLSELMSKYPGRN